MATYKYKGIDANSKTVSGTIDADSVKSARSKLRKQRIVPTKLQLEGAAGLGNKQFFNSVSATEIANFTRQWSVLLNSGIPLIDSLESLQSQVSHPDLKKSITEIKDKVSEGAVIGDTMQEYPKIFDSIYINMVRAGEASGALGLILERLADYKEGQTELKQKIKSAMTYPVIMVIVAILLIAYLFTSVIPKITKLFEKQKGTLPKPTEIIMNLTDFINNHGFSLVFVLILIGTGIYYYVKSKNGQRKIDELKLQLPKVKILSQKIMIARFSRTLSTLMNSGVQLIPALDIVKKVMDNVILEEMINEVIVEVREGENLNDSLRKKSIFPSMFLDMVAVGEKTGQLENMLEKVANTYDKEVGYAIDGLTSLITPLMLILMGGIIFFIVMAVIMPIMKLTSLQ